LSQRAFKKVLIANRGEIAVRVIRACHELELAAVAVYSEADRGALHVARADEAYPIGAAPARDSYLNIERLLAVARACGAEAVHPGYGFLAENAGFARACEQAGLVFIGPRSQTIAELGEKTSARRLASAAGLPVVPGSLEPIADAAGIAAEAGRIGYPVMLKAAAGGGGKGMRWVANPAALASAVARARGGAQGAFGDDRVYVEKALVRPRHIEIQVLADAHCNAVHLFERECSVQRRHQKIVEEAPSPFLTPELREQMGGLAVALVKRAGYVNAGTLEFLVDAERRPFFLEMNTRLQVEHAVTELTTGHDLVQLQIRIAQGQRLPFAQSELRQQGHAIECRVYAEDPEQGFLPSPGRILGLRVPGGPGLRDDSAIYEGHEVPIHYDPLLSKLIATGPDRADALTRMRRAVGEYRILGIKTNLAFFERVLRHPDFAAGDYDTSFVERVLAQPGPARQEPAELAAVAAALTAFRERRAARAPASDGGASEWWRAGLAEAQRRL